MPNHFHLAVERPAANLVAGMKWFLGDRQFGKELLAQMAERAGKWHYGEQLQESAEEQAEGLIHAGLMRKGWTERKTCKSAASETSSRWVLPDCRATQAMAGLLRLFVPRRSCKS